MSERLRDLDPAALGAWVDTLLEEEARLTTERPGNGGTVTTSLYLARLFPVAELVVEGDGEAERVEVIPPTAHIYWLARTASKGSAARAYDLMIEHPKSFPGDRTHGLSMSWNNRPGSEIYPGLRIDHHRYTLSDEEYGQLMDALERGVPYNPSQQELVETPDGDYEVRFRDSYMAAQQAEAAAEDSRRFPKAA